jgi:hypothetical protein
MDMIQQQVRRTRGQGGSWGKGRSRRDQSSRKSSTEFHNFYKRDMIEFVIKSMTENGQEHQY